jgi:hypothetical protein
MKVIAKLNVSHEDIVMRMFLHTFDGKVVDWYESLGEKSISPFTGFLECFSNVGILTIGSKAVKCSLKIL